MKRALVVAFSLLVIAISSVYVFDWPLHQGLSRVIDPVGSSLQQAGSRAYRALGEIPHLGRLQSELNQLEDEVTELRLETVSMNRLEEENRQLRNELEFARDYELEMQAADIVNHQPIPGRGFMKIAAGSNQGIAEDMPVVSEGVLLGRVDAVESDYSTVILASDTDFRALVDVEDSSGILRGQVGGGIIVERLESNAGLSEGDTVVTNGEDGIFPSDLLIGTVRSLEEGSGQIFQTASIDHELDPREMRAVMVVTE